MDCNDNIITLVAELIEELITTICKDDLKLINNSDNNNNMDEHEKKEKAIEDTSLMEQIHLSVINNENNDNFLNDEVSLADFLFFFYCFK